MDVLGVELVRLWEGSRYGRGSCWIVCSFASSPGQWNSYPSEIEDMGLRQQPFAIQRKSKETLESTLLMWPPLSDDDR